MFCFCFCFFLSLLSKSPLRACCLTHTPFQGLGLIEKREKKDKVQTYFYNQIEHSTDDCQVLDVTDNSHPMRSSILTKMHIVSDPFVKDAHITLTMWWLRLCSPNQASWLMFLKKCIYAKCKSDYLNNNPFFSLKGDAILELTADTLHPPSPPTPTKCVLCTKQNVDNSWIWRNG